MICTDKERETCNVEKMGCEGCYYNKETPAERRLRLIIQHSCYGKPDKLFIPKEKHLVLSDDYILVPIDLYLPSLINVNGKEIYYEKGIIINDNKMYKKYRKIEIKENN